MTDFIKKVIRPIFAKLGIYHKAYELFFLFREYYFFLTNIFKKSFCKTAVILMYHRVDTVSNDERLLVVTPEVFESHLIFLKERYEVIALPELVSRLQNKQLTGREAVITFDDGYLDNLTNALPLLEKYQLPATIFVTTGFLGEVSNLPWDSEYKIPADKPTFLNPQELKLLSGNPLITIGAHSVTHPRLSELANNDQATEILESKHALETILNNPISLFAYPFGGVFDYNQETIEGVRKAGFVAACATIPKLVTYKSALFELPRINIRNYPVRTLRKNLFSK